MGWFLLIAVVLAVLAVLAIKLKPLGRRDGESSPYIKSPMLFSPAERSFLGVLEQAVGEDFRVYGKVRVADVVSVKSLPDRRAWQQAFNRISAKHFDFVLCSKGDLSVVAAVELDDKSHQQRKRKERDGFLSGVCQAIALPLVQVPAQRAYSVHELRAEVAAAIGVQHEPALEQPTPATEESEVLLAQVESDAAAPVSSVASAVSDAPACPKCSSPMVRRQAKAGANVGQEFWGCSAFPKCRSIIPAIAQEPRCQQVIVEKKEEA